MLKHKDITGKKFSKLLVIKLNHIKKRPDNSGSDYYYLCQCDCGNKHIVRSKDLGRGTSSCGCFRKEFGRKEHTIHKLRYTPFYKRWAAMKSRCHNKNTRSFKRYGARGITVSDSWMQFDNFKEDMYESYLVFRESHKEFDTTIERIDNNKGYSKENCTWATRDEQAINKENNRLITINGISQSIAQWAKKSGISFQVISYRLKNKWSENQLLIPPTK